MTDSSRDGPLRGVRILELAEGIAAPFCTKLLGDLGADVVKVERPGSGDGTRSSGPFAGGVPGLESSASFFFLNTSKRSITLDLDTAEGLGSLEALTKRFDVVVASGAVESLARQDLDYARFRSWNPRVILTTVSAFGSFGPYSGYQSTDIVNCATGGWARHCGMPDRPPLQTGGGAITEALTGAYAAVATQLAILGRRRHGHGEHVDVSAMQSTLAGAMLAPQLYEYSGIVPDRYSIVGFGAGVPFILPTREGYLGVNALTEAQWVTLCDFLGRSDIADSDRFVGVSAFNPDERIDELREAFLEALADRTAEEVFHEAQVWRVPFGLVPDMQRLYAMPPLQERGYFVELEHPAVGSVSVPGIPFTSNAVRPKPYRPPLLGEHTDSVLAELASSPDVGEATPAAEHTLPLAGIRVLDLAMFFAGPAASQIMADAGAEVIKVESVQRIDGWRGSSANWSGEVPPWESSPSFNWINRNKYGITLNLKDQRGADIIKHMVREADIVVENYTPRVMERFGLSYEVLRDINPRVIMLSLSGFGATTSWCDYVAFGMSTEQLSGMCHLTGYEGGQPMFTGTTGGDIFAGVMGANVLLAAIHHRDRTGAGQHIDLSQVEACNLYLGDVMTGWALAGVDPGRTGNAHPAFAPHGMYPCADDRWIAIACRTDEEFEALAHLMGRQDWAGAGAAYRDVGERRAHCDEIDQALGEWTSAHDCLELMHRLQGEGIPAGAVMTSPDYLDDPHLAARDALVAQEHPGLGVKHYPSQPYRFRFAPPQPNRRTPLLGEHSRQVLSEHVGLSDDQLDELEADDVIGTVPMAAR